MSGPRILPINAERPERGALEQAAAVLRGGGLVAFPTETVYGLGANALDPVAVARIYSAKGRPPFNPIITHVASVSQARTLVADWPEVADRLAAAFWPGPLTLVLPRHPRVPEIVTAGGPSVAVRLPAHPVARALIEVAELPVAAPSANRSSAVSPTTAEHVAKSLGSRVDLILDAGATQVGIESTVVDLTGERPVVLRPGPIGPGQLADVVGPLGEAAPVAPGTAPRPSPGLLDRHYAPHARVQLFPAHEHQAIAEQLHRAMARNQVVGGLLLSVDLPGQHMLRMPAEPAEYARALYAALHQLDDLGCQLVVVESVPPGIFWGGVRDRLIRAATPEP